MIITLLAASTHPLPLLPCMDDNDDRVDHPIVISCLGIDDQVVRGWIRRTKEVGVSTNDGILFQYLPIKHLCVVSTKLLLTFR